MQAGIGQSLTSAVSRALEKRPMVFIGQTFKVSARRAAEVPSHDLAVEAAMIRGAVKSLSVADTKHLPSHTAYDYYAYCAR